MHAQLLLHQTNCNYVGVLLVSYGECFIVTVISWGVMFSGDQVIEKPKQGDGSMHG